MLTEIDREFSVEWKAFGFSSWRMKGELVAICLLLPPRHAEGNERHYAGTGDEHIHFATSEKTPSPM